VVGPEQVPGPPLTAFGIAGGVYSTRNVPLDAIPDLSDPQVIIYTEWPGRSPDLVEDQITYPIVSSRLDDGKGARQET